MKAEILEIRPSAVYQGDTYTQGVVITTGDDIAFRVEDPEMLCSEADIGTEQSLTLHTIADFAVHVKQVETDTLVFEPYEPEKGSGIRRLRTEIIDVFPDGDASTRAVAALPSGDIQIVFSRDGLPEDLPIDYQPVVGDWLEFENISRVTLKTLEKSP